MTVTSSYNRKRQTRRQGDKVTRKINSGVRVRLRAGRTQSRIANSQSPIRNRQSSVPKGQALVPVIFVMLILTVVGVSFSVSARRSAHASGNYVAQTQRLYAAQGAMNYAMAALAQTSSNGATYGIVPALPDTDANGWAQFGDAWVKVDVVDTGACVNLNSVTLAALQKMPVFRDNPDLANAIVQWRGTQSTASASGAASTGGASSGSGATGATSSASGDDPYQGLSTPYTLKNAPFDTVEELLLVQGMTPTLLYGNAAGSPISALDAENDAATSSASGTTSGTSSTSGRTRSIGRSRQAVGARPGGAGGATVTGGTGSTGGTGTAANGGASAGGTGSGTPAAAPPEDFSDIYTDSKVVLAQLFTTVARDRNLATDGTARVNVNTATAQDLQDKLGLTADEANGLIRFRSGQNGQGGQGGQGNRPGNTNGGNGSGGTGGNAGSGAGGNAGGAVAPRVSNTPRSVYSTNRLSRQAAGGIGTNRPPTTPTGGQANPSTTTNGGGTSGSGAGGSGTTQSSTFKTIADLLESPTFTRTVMQRVADKVAIDDKGFRENVVNINTAPAEVLATVPGMTHAIINAIVTYRQGGKSFQDLGDFFSLQELQRTDFQAVIPYLTTKTATYYVHIRVRTPGQQSVYAVSALVEMSDAGPHVLQWRETPHTPGWSTWMTPPTLPTPTPGQNNAGSSGSSQTQ